MLIATCTQTVQHRSLDVAPLWCNISAPAMHQNGATSGTFETRDLAPVGVQHQRPNVAPLRCKVSCTILVQHRKTEPTYGRYGQQNPSCTGVQDGRFLYRDFTSTHLTPTSHRRNHLTARAEQGRRRAERGVQRG